MAEELHDCIRYSDNGNSSLVLHCNLSNEDFHFSFWIAQQMHFIRFQALRQLQSPGNNFL